MRSDPLTGAETTKVSLVNGDFYALLNLLGNRAAFEVEVPGVETETQSSDFWVKHEGGESRFANYDAPALEITRGDEKIRLGENEGAVIRRRARRSAPTCWRGSRSPSRSTASRSTTPR